MVMYNQMYKPGTEYPGSNKRKISILSLIFGISLISFSGTGCSLFTTGSSSVKLIINNLPPEITQSASGTANRSEVTGPSPLIALAQAPAGLKSLALTISGPEMTTLNYYYYTIPSSIAIEVPAGKARQFTLEAYLDPSLQTAALSFRGEAMTDLNPGESRELSLKMVVGETKLVIPDKYGYRLVQMNNMQGDGWVEKKNTDYGFMYSTDFQPTDIDFDASGRTYFIFGGVNAPAIYRIDNVHDTTTENIISGNPGVPYVGTFAIDRQTDYAYYSTSNTVLGIWDIGNGIRKKLLPAVTGITNIYNIAVSDKGILYISGLGGTIKQIFKFDPYTGTNGTIQRSWSDSNLDNPYDILVKKDYILVTNPSGAAGYKIVKLDLDLNYINSYGYTADSTAPDKRSGYFYAPYSFVAVPNRKVYMLEDGESFLSSDGDERIVAFTDPSTWAGWSVFRASDIGKDPFTFYNYGFC